jgi:hypothetical protein
MTDRDPAVEAAQRSCSDPTVIRTYVGLSVAAAREALAPLKELHRVGVYGYCKECGHEGGRWPCDSAKLIYPESEIQ